MKRVLVMTILSIFVLHAFLGCKKEASTNEPTVKKTTTTKPKVVSPKSAVTQIASKPSRIPAATPTRIKPVIETSSPFLGQEDADNKKEICATVTSNLAGSYKVTFNFIGTDKKVLFPPISQIVRLEANVPLRVTVHFEEPMGEYGCYVHTEPTK